jgi:hypothetical protein
VSRPADTTAENCSTTRLPNTYDVLERRDRHIDRLPHDLMDHFGSRVAAELGVEQVAKLSSTWPYWVMSSAFRRMGAFVAVTKYGSDPKFSRR